LGAGVVSGDTVSLVVSNAAFNDKNIGSGKPVTADLGLSGADAGNYTVNATASATANSTARAITVTAGTNTKTYDATTSAAAVSTVTSGSLASGDAVTWTEAYSSKTVGSGNKTLVPSATVSDGNGGNDYAVTFVNFTTGTN